jgi:23S rRNA (guanosine2251-2'-O)-methyltransferase
MTERIVYGLHTVRALIERRPQSLVRAHLLENSRELDSLAAAINQLGVPLLRVRRTELDRMSGGGAHQGVVVEVRPAPEFGLNDFESLVARRGRDLRLLVLDGVEDPRNLGACLRTADAAGVDAVVTPRVRAASLTATAAKAATGAAETMPLLRVTNLARTLAWLKQVGVWVVGADQSAGRTLYDCVLTTPVALVLGGEGAGLRRLTRDSCDELVAIPMRGTVASLNVSVAAGVALYELDRQCRQRAPDTRRA